VEGTGRPVEVKSSTERKGPANPRAETIESGKAALELKGAAGCGCTIQRLGET